MKQIQHPSQDGQWGQLSWPPPWARAGSLCACGGASGPAVKPAVASGQKKPGPTPISSLFPQLSGAALRALPHRPWCWASRGTWPPHSGGALRGPVDRAQHPPRARSPRTPWLRSGCRTGRSAGAQSPHGCGADAGRGGAGADAANCGGEGGGEARPCAPGAPLYEQVGPRHGPVTGPPAPLVLPRSRRVQGGEGFLPCLLETSRELGCAGPPLPPTPGSGGEASRAPSVPFRLHLPPPARPGNLGFAGIQVGRYVGGREGGREPRKHAAGRFSPPRSRPPPRTTLPQFLRLKPPFPFRKRSP